MISSQCDSSIVASLWIPIDMEWAKPEYSRSKVDAAGKALIRADANAAEFDQAVEVLINWRAAHLYPLGKFRETLDALAVRIEPDATLVHRLKRAVSVFHKLILSPNMRLSQMQDIGGCRVVLESIDQIRELQRICRSDCPHELLLTDDYIQHPKDSGYRSLHMIYRFNETGPWNRLWLELQIRTRLQHSWATALETIATFTNQALKSNQGDEEWLYFFKLMGNYLAARENCNPVPNILSGVELQAEIKKYVAELNVVKRLTSWKDAVGLTAHLMTSGRSPDTQQHRYFLLSLDTAKKEANYIAYGADELEEANREYSIREAAAKDLGIDVVLVAAETAAELREAYPNYFADTDIFLTHVEEAMGLGQTELNFGK